MVILDLRLLLVCVTWIHDMRKWFLWYTWWSQKLKLSIHTVAVGFPGQERALTSDWVVLKDPIIVVVLVCKAWIIKPLKSTLPCKVTASKKKNKKNKHKLTIYKRVLLCSHECRLFQECRHRHCCLSEKSRCSSSLEGPGKRTGVQGSGWSRLLQVHRTSRRLLSPILSTREPE